MFEQRRGYVESYSDVLSPQGEVTPQMLQDAQRVLTGERGSCTALWRRLEHDAVTQLCESPVVSTERMGQILLAPKRRAPRAAAAILQQLQYPVQMVEDPRGTRFRLLELVRDVEAGQLVSMLAMALGRGSDGKLAVTHWDKLYFGMSDQEPVVYQQSELPQVSSVLTAAVLYEGARQAYVAATGRFLLDRRAA